jgi:hypothetical protein
MGAAMRKAILMLLLAVASSSALAAWVEVDTSKADVLYADPATIRKVGKRAKMWSLIDFKTIQSGQGIRFMSSKTQYEYNCKAERGRVLFFSWHAGNMGRGEIVYSDDEPGKWGPLPPGSRTEMLWEVACGTATRH